MHVALNVSMAMVTHKYRKNNRWEVANEDVETLGSGRQSEDG
jgi:hypothetical protein